MKKNLLNFANNCFCQDEKNQQLTTSSWMNVNWKDERLSWNTSKWNGVQKLHIPHERIWKPDIILTNKYNETNKYVT